MQETNEYRAGWKDAKRDSTDRAQCCGYRNWETFTVITTITNDRGPDGLDAAREALTQCRADNEYEFEVAAAFREWWAEFENLGDDGADLNAIIVQGFLESIEWREVTQAVTPDQENEQ